MNTPYEKNNILYRYVDTNETPLPIINCKS